MTDLERTAGDTFQLPDGSVLYSFDRAIEEYKRLKSPDYSVNDLILFLLHSQRDQPVKGRTVAFKEIFLLEQEIFSDYLFDWDQVPGPQSGRLIYFLKDHLGLRFPERPRIERAEDQTIKIHGISALYVLTLNKYRTNATLYQETASNRNSLPERSPLYTFFVRIGLTDDRLKIYSKKKNIEDCGFIPYHFGPYSFLVASKLEQLETTGLIVRRGKKDTKNESFKISQLGDSVIMQKYLALPAETRRALERSRKGWDQYGTDGILRHVYQYFPQYREKSKISNRYKLISWGKGRG